MGVWGGVDVFVLDVFVLVMSVGWICLGCD